MTTQILTAIIAAIGAALATGIPAGIAARRARKSEQLARADAAIKAATAGATEHFNAVIAGWVALYGSATKQFEDQLNEIRTQLEECKQRDTEKSVRLAELERRMGPEADNR